MKKQFQFAAMLLALCLAFSMAPPLGRAIETRKIIPVGIKDNLIQVVANAQDGDIIEINGSCAAIDPTGSDAPWVIDRAVTIRGGTLTVHAGGIILNADVTFQNTVLAFGGFIRNAILANGHTLTLENVTCNAGSRSVHLFCGGLYDDVLGSQPGKTGCIVVRGETSLQGSEEPGNLYAGNLCMGGLNPAESALDGPANQFKGDAVISIETGEGTLGSIYAGGAQQKNPTGGTGKVVLTDPREYTVDGRVDIRLTGSVVREVFGMGAAETHVTYRDDGYNNLAEIWVDGLSSFHAESGYAVPVPAASDLTILETVVGLLRSSFREGAALSVAPDAKLDLMKNPAVLTVDRFTGGGRLILDPNQTLRLTGPVTGETEVQIGAFLSTSAPQRGQVYLQAPQSRETSFRLVPPNSWQSLFLTRDGAGNWTVAGFDMPLASVRFETPDASCGSGETEAVLPLLPEDAKGNPYRYLDDIPLEIRVNGQLAERKTEVYEEENMEFFVYTRPAERLTMEIYVNDLTVTEIDGGELPDGVYFVELTVPGAHTDTGEALYAAATLVVGELPDASYRIAGIALDGKTATVHVLGPGGAAPEGVILAAAYDSSGRMTGAAMAPAAGRTAVPVALDTSGAAEVRAFLTDSRQVPLCKGHSAAVRES